MTAVVAGHVSLAFHQNSIPVVSEIKLDNKSEAFLSDVEVSITCEPAVIAPVLIRIDGIAAGAIHYVPTLDLRLDAALLRAMTEGVRADLSLVVRQDGIELATLTTSLQLLPASHWGGYGSAPELLAAFVRPNDPAIDTILHEASKRLSSARKPSGIDGYASERRERPWDIASAIWSALAAQGITYVLPPASFERMGQKVRSPSDVMERRTATCLDTTLLLAACFEQAGLDSLVVLTQGHAFVGLWLQKADVQQALVDDGQVLRKRRDLQELVLVETTLLTHNPPARFSEAVRLGGTQVDEDAAARFELALDVRRARMRQIRPLDFGDGTKSSTPLSPDASPVDLGLDEAPIFVDEIVVPAVSDRHDDRLERWKRKLLDLTAKNKLLNFKDAGKAIAIEVSDAGRLEDMLVSGTKFRFLPRSDVLDGKDGRDAGLHRDRHHDDGRRAFLAQALEAGDLHTRLGTDELDARLTELFRLARTAFEEGGSNVLYLALGFLTWVQAKGGKPYRAPILLVPVALKRRSVRSGFRMELHEEEARFNPTLVEMLRQDFDLALPEFERELPTDASGLAVDKIWQGLRHHVKDLNGWEVTPDVALSTFSFTKFLMWRDLVDRVEALKANPVVCHLIDTPKQSYGDGSRLPEARDIDRDYHPRDVFAPLSADWSSPFEVVRPEVWL